MSATSDTAQDLPRGSMGIVALAAIVAALLVLNWYLLVSPVDTSPIAPAANPANRERGGSNLTTPLDGKPASAFSEFVQRPLFNSNRRPVDRPKPEVLSAPTTPAGRFVDLRLVGVSKSASTPGRALLRFAGEQAGHWITEGETVNGWKLRSVSEQSVVVESGGISHELLLWVIPRPPDDEQASGTEKAR